MSQTSDQIAALDQMKSEGRISDEEYEDLRVGILGPDDDVPDDGDPNATGSGLPRLRSDRSVSFIAGIVAASVFVIFVAYLGVLPWLAAVLGVVALLATLFEKGIFVSAAAGVGLGVIVITGLTGGSSSPVANVAPVADTTPVANEPVAGSLGMYVEELPEMWNTVSEPPEIRDGFTRYAESGDYDSFLYRFGDWGRFAGAYDRGNDAVYALAASGQFHNGAVADLYLHLCYIVEPFSQECIDAYFEQGLEGGVLDDYIDGSHKATWQLGENTWSVDIDGNVLTLRVLAPEVS